MRNFHGWGTVQELRRVYCTVPKMEEVNIEERDEFLESSTPHGYWLHIIDNLTNTCAWYIFLVCCTTGEFVVGIARGVGLLVAIVSIFILIFVMMIIRAVIASLLRKMGVTGVILLMGVASGCALKFRNISGNFVWNVLSRTCCWYSRNLLISWCCRRSKIELEITCRLEDGTTLDYICLYHYSILYVFLFPILA